MKTYENTHPWIKFSADLQRANPKLWITLGECQSKCEHIAGVPLRPDTAALLHRLYLAKGILATTAIEGNTLSEEEVLQHLEGKLKLPPSREYLAQEIENIWASCNMITSRIQRGESLELSADAVKEFNRLVLNKLALPQNVVPGQVRTYSVGVARYRGAPPEDCEYLLEKLCDWLNSEEFAPKPGMEIVYAILKAILAHLYLAWIHPFGDGNGRTARLIEFQILIASGVPAPAAHLLSNHYNQTRTEYYRQLDRASQSGGEILPFLGYTAQGLLDGLKSQIARIREQQWDVTWRNYVHEAFSDKKSPSHIRCRHLTLDLSGKKEPVSLDKLPEISPRLAAAYARKTRKTLSRDLNMLLKMELVIREKTGYRARKELILAFLPIKAETLEANSAGG